MVYTILPLWNNFSFLLASFHPSWLYYPVIKLIRDCLNGFKSAILGERKNMLISAFACCISTYHAPRAMPAISLAPCCRPPMTTCVARSASGSSTTSKRSYSRRKEQKTKVNLRKIRFSWLVVLLPSLPRQRSVASVWDWFARVAQLVCVLHYGANNWHHESPEQYKHSRVTFAAEMATAILLLFSNQQGWSHLVWTITYVFGLFSVAVVHTKSLHYGLSQHHNLLHRRLRTRCRW